MTLLRLPFSCCIERHHSLLTSRLSRTQPIGARATIQLPSSPLLLLPFSPPENSGEDEVRCQAHTSHGRQQLIRHSSGVDESNHNFKQTDFISAIIVSSSLLTDLSLVYGLYLRSSCHDLHRRLTTSIWLVIFVRIQITYWSWLANYSFT